MVLVGGKHNYYLTNKKNPAAKKRYVVRHVTNHVAPALGRIALAGYREAYDTAKAHFPTATTAQKRALAKQYYQQYFKPQIRNF